MKMFIFIDWEEQEIGGYVKASTKAAAWKIYARTFPGYVSKQMLDDRFTAVEVKNIR